jgi:hypothetical protein
MQLGPHLVDRKRKTEQTLRQRVVAEFSALRARLDESEKRILASLDADSTDAA